MAVKFLHTADWQLDRSFGRLPEDAAVPMKEQRIATVKKIASLATKHNVDAVLVAGDVFDFETIAEKTLHKTLHAMSGFKGQWLLLPGNHDPGIPEGVWSQLRRLDALTDNIVLLDKPQAYALPGTNAVVLAAPLQRKHEATDLTEWFDNHVTDAGIIRIGLAHGSMDNRLPERGEAPNTISDMRAEKAKLDYLALGDWHGTLNVAKNTWYSGTHETDRFRDNESGNVLLVSIEEAGAKPQVEKIPVGFYRWCQLELSLDSQSDAAEVDRTLAALGEPEDSLVVQLTLRGSASLEMRAAIDKVITKWSGLCRYLECRDQQLVGQASEGDLDQLGRAGFVGEAVARLRLLSEDATNPERDVADLALQILYSEHAQLVNKR